MKTLKNEGLKSIEKKARSIKVWRTPLALVLTAAFVAVSALGPAQLALADGGGGEGHTFTVTSTMWMTTMPANSPSFAGMSLAGIAGGAVGNGRFAALVLDDNLSVPGFWLGHTRMEFHGEDHSFIADVHITENDTVNPVTAVFIGVVTHGWLKGAHVTGEYTSVDVCPIPTPGNVFGTLCFQAKLHLHRGHGSDE